jgi:purine-cytosine permease-like protein
MGLASEAYADHSQRWWHLSSIQLAGGIISVPLIALGAEVLFSNGIVDALLSIIVGNAIIFFLSLCIVLMSFKERLNAIENATLIVGKKGGRILALLVLITMIGWLARQLFAGAEVLQVSPFFSKFSIGSLIGGIASLVTLFGIKGLKNLCIFLIIPLLLLFFLILMNVEAKAADYEIVIPNKFNLAGTSLIVSSLVASIVDFPTFFRHSKSKRDSIISLLVIFVTTIVIQSMGVFLFHIFLVDKMFIKDLIFHDVFYSHLISMFLILSMTTSAAWNVYAASVGWESLFPVFKDRTEYAVIGLTATLLFSAVQVNHMLVFVTDVCDTLISGIAGVLVFDFVRKKIFSPKEHAFEIPYNNLSWWFGGCAGLLTYFNVFLTSSYSSFVSLITGFVFVILTAQLRQIYGRLVNGK